ncbi:hypothetical protein DMUE_5696 [Dictyocoela muelleri]|nr:hypothetical protein DMUE_5696 [Dictyocoela muelleri]
MEKHNINHIVTSSYNPRVNNISERINRSILQTFSQSKGLKLNELVKNIFIFLNYNANRRLRLSPFELIYKYSPFDITKQNLESEILNAKNYELLNSKKEIKKNKGVIIRKFNEVT